MKFSLIKPSTFAFWRESRRLSGYSLLDFIHGYVYVRWPYFYIGVGKGKHPAAKWLAPLGGLFDQLITKKKKMKILRI